MACGGSLLWCGRRPGEGGKEAEEAVSTAGSPRRRHARERERGRESAHAQARVRECVYTSKETLGLAKKLHIQRKGAALWILFGYIHSAPSPIKQEMRQQLCHIRTSDATVKRDRGKK